MNFQVCVSQPVAVMFLSCACAQLSVCGTQASLSHLKGIWKMSKEYYKLTVKWFWQPRQFECLQWSSTQGVCCCCGKKRRLDYKEKMSTYAQKPRQIWFWLAVALTSKCKPDLSSSFCFSALRGPFDSPKGKTCQKQFLLCWCSGLQSFLLLLLLPLFLSSIHHCSRGAIIPQQWVMRVIDGSCASFSVPGLC